MSLRKFISIVVLYYLRTLHRAEQEELIFYCAGKCAAVVEEIRRRHRRKKNVEEQFVFISGNIMSMAAVESRNCP
jgi:hypothetical protein